MGERVEQQATTIPIIVPREMHSVSSIMPGRKSGGITEQTTRKIEARMPGKPPRLPVDSAFPREIIRTGDLRCWLVIPLHRVECRCSSCSTIRARGSEPTQRGRWSSVEGSGVTRGKSLVVLVGTSKAIAIAVNRADANRRYCGLNRRLASVAATA